MKLILENWRDYQKDAMLLEEGEVIFSELDKETLDENILKDFIAKVVGWIGRVWERVKELAKAGVDRTLALLKGVWDKVSKFCQKHKAVCAAIAIILVAMAVYATIAYLLPATAAAATMCEGVMCGGELMTQSTLDALEAFILNTSSFFGSEQEGVRLMAKLREMHEAAETFDLSQPDKLTSISEGVAKQLEGLINQLRQREGTELYNRLVEIGQNLHAEVVEIQEHFRLRTSSGGQRVDRVRQVGKWVRGGQ